VLIVVVIIGVVLTPLEAAAARSPHTGHPATCAKQSGASFPGAFTSGDNLVVGPLSMIGASTYTSAATAHKFGGNKFPVLVKPGHTVTVRVSRRTHRSASLFYAINRGGALTETHVSDGLRAITFRACDASKAQSDADGDPVTFWSGFVVVSKPVCVQLKIWIDSERKPHHRHISLGRRC
jgi:hypothetical protein